MGNGNGTFSRRGNRCKGIYELLVTEGVSRRRPRDPNRLGQICRICILLERLVPAVFHQSSGLVSRYQVACLPLYQSARTALVTTHSVSLCGVTVTLLGRNGPRGSTVVPVVSGWTGVQSLDPLDWWKTADTRHSRERQIRHTLITLIPTDRASKSQKKF